MFIKVLEIGLDNTFSPLGKAWQAALKRTRVKLDLLIDIDILLTEEKLIENVMF